MTMRIQDTLSNCCEGIKEFASAAFTWIGRTVSAIGASLYDMAMKVGQFVRPYFEQLRNFVQNNQQMVIIGVIGAAVGGLLVTIINSVFCRQTQPQQQQPQGTV